MNAFANALLDSSRAAAAAVGPNSSRPAAAKRSATPKLSGSSGPTTVRSTFSRWASARRACRGPQIGRTGRHEPRNPRISRRADDARRRRVRRPAADQRVLARAAAEDQNLHCLNDLWRVPALHTGEVWPGTISLTLTGFAPRIRVYV